MEQYKQMQLLLTKMAADLEMTSALKAPPTAFCAYARPQGINILGHSGRAFIHWMHYSSSVALDVICGCCLRYGNSFELFIRTFGTCTLGLCSWHYILLCNIEFWIDAVCFVVYFWLCVFHLVHDFWCTLCAALFFEILLIISKNLC